MFLRRQSNIRILKSPFNNPNKREMTSSKFLLVADMGCLPFSKKVRKFRLKVKWSCNFLENPCGNCRLPSEVVLFSVRNGTGEISLPFAKLSSFQSLISGKQLREIELQMVSAISFGWFTDFGKTLTIIQWSSQPVYCDKW